MQSLINAETKIKCVYVQDVRRSSLIPGLLRVSSTLDKSVGKKNLTDGSPETCWTSQQVRGSRP